MEYNLSPYEIAFRYTLMAILVVIAMLGNFIWLAPIAMAVFLTAILGTCPLYTVLGINNAGKID